MSHGNMSLSERDLLPQQTQHYINGMFVKSQSGETFPSVAPASDQHLADVALGCADDVERAVEAGQKALRGPWGQASQEQRVDVLRKIADGIHRRRQQLAHLEALDTGKPLTETLTGDIPRAAQNMRFFADLLTQQRQETYTSDDGSTHTCLRSPVGIVGLITPWNLPLYLATWKLAPALAAGNVAILKPAELTPLTACVLGEILTEAGLPKGVVAILQGHGADGVGEAIVTHPQIRAISFTGETTTGVAIGKAAAPHLKKLSFELGGKGASVVFADARLDHAIPQVERAAFRNQGQICLAGSRLLVEERIANEFLDGLLGRVGQIRLGDPLDPETTMGSLICKEHRDKVATYVDLAKGSTTPASATSPEPSMQILAGGNIPEGFPGGAYFEPTVINAVPQDSPLIQEEIFGPVLTVQTFKSEDEARSLLNGTPYGLSCSVYTEDRQRARRMAAAARCGLVWLNTWFSRNLHTAFGGMKRSGVGREGGRWSLDFFSEMKTITEGALELPPNS